MEKTALFYMYGMPQDELNGYEKVNLKEVGLFADPDMCVCGGTITWKKSKWNSLVMKGVCTECGKEQRLSE